MTQQFYFWVYPKNRKQRFKQIFVRAYAKQHDSQDPKGRSNSSVPQQMKDKQNVVHLAKGILVS